MGELDQLKAAAAALEAQRATLGADVVAAGLRPLRERIDALESPVAEERKLVTTLFADLVGFTAMSERLDAEDVRTVLDRYFARWAALIEGHGGVVEKFIGDAVMAVFGMKQASENDAERAIFAALDMVQSLADLNENLADEGGPRLEMRVGINTGEVVIGAVGERRQEEWIAVGDPINVAARLQAAAPVNGVLIAHSTFRHVRGVFDLREVPPLALKGKSEDTRGYVVERAKPRAFRLPARGVEGVETAMVGREAELTRLQDAFLAASEGEPGMVTIVGEAGTGQVASPGRVRHLARPTTRRGRVLAWKGEAGNGRRRFLASSRCHRLAIRDFRHRSSGRGARQVVGWLRRHRPGPARRRTRCRAVRPDRSTARL